jgi:hypothetical protein
MCLYNARFLVFPLAHTHAALFASIAALFVLWLMFMDSFKYAPSMLSWTFSLLKVLLGVGLAVSQTGIQVCATLGSCSLHSVRTACVCIAAGGSKCSKPVLRHERAVTPSAVASVHRVQHDLPRPFARLGVLVSVRCVLNARSAQKVTLRHLTLSATVLPILCVPAADCCPVCCGGRSRTLDFILNSLR